MLPDPEALPPLHGAVQPGVTAQRGVESVGGDEDARRKRAVRGLHLHGAVAIRKAFHRGPPSDLDAAPGGRPGEGRREGCPPDAEPAPGRERAGDRRPVLLDVADPLDRGAVLGAEKLACPERLQDRKARRHESLPARLVRGTRTPLTDDGRQAGPRGERGGCEAGRAGTGDRDVHVGSRRHGGA